LLVLGHIEGDVSLGGDLHVGESARLVASVEADSVDVAGSIEGDVMAKGTVNVRRGATLRGNVHGASIAIEEGAEFAGRLHAEFDLPAELRGAATGARDRRR
jgi:cytoskeletal protein CcmA (bactofilin family)